MRSLLPKKLSLSSWILIAVLFLATAVRLWSVWDNNIFFYYDQARDATTATQIFSQRDIKIMGPSVSGTEDSIYHGVLYYYFVGFLYWVGSGSPFVAVLGVITVNILATYLVYYLGRVVFGSAKVGLCAAAFYAVGVIPIHQGTWLSNPTLSTVALPLAYLYIWKVFFAKAKPTLATWAVLGLSIAFSMQAALQNVTVLGACLVAYLYSRTHKPGILTIRSFLAAALAGTVGIASMLLTELLMYRRGILSFESMRLSEHSISFWETLQKIAARYFALYTDILTPTLATAVLAVVIAAFLVRNWNMAQPQLIWLLACATAPLWLLLWHFRDPNHTFIGFEVLLYLMLSVAILSAAKRSVTDRILAIAVVVIVLSSNAVAVADWKEKQYHYYGIQRGAFLHEQLATIDATYAKANGEPFSIATLTSPYAINTTWNYLYLWYGAQQYGSVPTYVGLAQSFFVGGEVLPEGSPEEIHFAIVEPDTTLDDHTTAKFVRDQLGDEEVRAETLAETEHQSFGTVRLYTQN